MAERVDPTSHLPDAVEEMVPPTPRPMVCPSDARLLGQADGRRLIVLRPSDGGSDPMASDGIGSRAIDTSSSRSPMHHPDGRGSGHWMDHRWPDRMASEPAHHWMSCRCVTGWHRVDRIRPMPSSAIGEVPRWAPAGLAALALKRKVNPES